MRKQPTKASNQTAKTAKKIQSLPVPEETLNLLQDKETAKKKLEQFKTAQSKTQNVVHKILLEAKQAKSKLPKLKNALIPEITAEEFINAIRRKKFFFRGLVVTGDVDLSQLDNKNLTQLDLGNVTFKGTFNASGCKLKGINCQGALFEKDVVFDSADMRDVNFKDAKFKEDLHVDQKTKLGKRKRYSTYKVNERTEVNRTTYKLGAAELPDIGFTYQDLTSVSPEHFYATLDGKRPLVAVYVAGEKLSDDSQNASEVSRFWKAFETQYKLICDQEKLFKHFRGNIVERLKNKEMSDAEKIRAIVLHAQREPGGRTARALKKVLPEFRPAPKPVAREEVSTTPISMYQVSSSSTPRSVPSSLSTALGSLQRNSRFGISPTQHMLESSQSVSDKMRFFLRNEDGALLVDRVLKFPDGFTETVRNYVAANAEERLITIDTVLFAHQENAKNTLSQLDVVASFSLSSNLLSLSEENAYEKRQKEIVASYLLLKASEPDDDAVAVFEQKRDESVKLLNQAIASPIDFLEKKAQVSSAFQFVKMVNGDQDATLVRFSNYVAAAQNDIKYFLEAFDKRSPYDFSEEALLAQQQSFAKTKNILQVLSADDSGVSRKIAKSKKILDDALTDFRTSCYLFGNEDAKSKRTEDKKTVVCAYLFLKAVGETDAVAHYDNLLRNKIYPNYLNFATRPAAERNGGPKFRYNLAEELFIRSGTVEAANHLAVQSGQRGQVGGGAGLFARKEISSKEVFEMGCLKRWANLSLSFLQEAGLVDSAIVTAVQAKMAAQPTVPAQDRLCMERIFYLEELIRSEKFEEAKREAKAIKAGYAEQLRIQHGQENVFADLLDKQLRNVIDEIKWRIVAETKQVLAAHKPDDDHLLGTDKNHLLNKSSAVYEARKDALEEIFTALFDDSYAPLRSEIRNMGAALFHSATNTYALTTIAERVLENQSFHHSLLLAFVPILESKYHVVWVGKGKAKDAMVQRLSDAIVEEGEKIATGEGNISRKTLLEGLKNCISGVKPIDGLLTTPLKIENVSSQLVGSDVVLMNRGAIGAEYAIQLVEKAFEPLWLYAPIQGAMTRSEKGLEFADPKDPKTRNLIGNPAINFPKYECVVMLNAALSSFRKNLNHDGICQDKKYHEKITDNFVQLIKTLNDVKDLMKEKREQGKTFDKLILNESTQTGVLAEVQKAQIQWVEYSSAMSADANLSQNHERDRPYKARRFSL